MVRVTSATPDIAISRHGLLTEAFELLASGLGPFVDERMSGYFADTEEVSWEMAAANRMGRAHEHGASDPLFQLLVLRRFWGPVFADFYGEDLRPLVQEVVEARNLWAHFNLPPEPDYLDRVMLSLERLLAPIAPDDATRIRRLKSRLRLPETEVLPTPSDAEEAVLRTQLGETEVAFQQLQNEFSQIARQLELSRKASAGKQLRLSMLERELAEASTEAEELRSHISIQAGINDRVHWMFAAFIAMMMVLMVLAAG